MELITTREIENFGRNLRFIPQAYFEPVNEAELIEILDRHSGCNFRAVGSLHSWSEAAYGDEVIISLRLFDQVEPVSTAESKTSEANSVWVGAGIQIKHLLEKLNRIGKTLPSLGLITEQTLAGAVSTGTHGSGRHCLSHYVQAVRIVHYCNDTRRARITTIEGGDALRAVQCGVGNCGIITAIKVEVRDSFQIEELWRAYDTLDQVLEMEKQFPLQQFFLLPWKWTYLAQHRCESNQSASWREWLYRVYFFLTIDIGLHIVLITAGKLFNNKKMVQWLFRKVLSRAIVKDWRVVGPSPRMLVMEHELFHHIETELFVTADRLSAAIDFVQKSLKWSAGDGADLPDDYLRQVASTGLTGEFQAARGAYGHHYPICIRRVQPDSTMISMSSGGNQDWYAISLISYHRLSNRDGFFKAMNFLARAMALLFNARPHWGKHVPLSASELVALYPEFENFKNVLSQLDPSGQFRNRWFAQLVSESHKE